MTEYMKVDTAFACRIRTGRTVIASQADVSGPQLVPQTAMPGRRLLRIYNYGRLGSPRTNVYVVIGDHSIHWTSTPTEIWGYGLEVLEFIDLPIDDNIKTYAIADITLESGKSVDLRTMELG